MKRISALAAILCFPIAAFGQTGDVKEDILRKVRERLESARRAILEQVGRMIDEELAARSEGSGEKPLEKRLRELGAEEGRVRAELKIQSWAKRDKKQYDRARREGLEAAEAEELFNDAYKEHQDRNFKSSVEEFKRIVYALHDHKDKGLAGHAVVAAYNAACGYALDGHKDEGLDWLEISAGLGFLGLKDDCHDSSLEHMEQDTDLVTLRGEERYRDLVRKAKAGR